MTPIRHHGHRGSRIAVPRHLHLVYLDEKGKGDKSFRLFSTSETLMNSVSE